MRSALPCRSRDRGSYLGLGTVKGLCRERLQMLSVRHRDPGDPPASTTSRYDAIVAAPGGVAFPCDGYDCLSLK